MNIETLKEELDTFRDDNGVLASGAESKITKEFKHKVVAYHYKSGISITILARGICMAPSAMARWKKEHGTKKTGFIHGRTIRNDVRTKCLAVKDRLETDMTLQQIAMKYNTSTSTLFGWVSKYKYEYKEYIETIPDGVPYMVKKEKMVYGDANIEKMLHILNETNGAIETIMKNMHNLGKLETSVLKEFLKDNNSKLSKIDEIQRLQKEIGVI